MATAGKVQRTFQLAGQLFQDSINLAGVANFNLSVAPVTAKQALTSALSSGAFTATMAAGGHGITTGSIVDVYWTAGGVKKCRYNMTVGTVSGNTVPITASGGGDTAPADATTVYVAKVTNEPVALVGDNVDAVAAQAAQGTTDDVTVTFLDDSGAALLSSTIDATNNAMYGWFVGSGVTNPLAGVTVASINVSNRSTTATPVVTVSAMY